VETNVSSAVTNDSKVREKVDLEMHSVRPFKCLQLVQQGSSYVSGVHHTSSEEFLNSSLSLLELQLYKYSFLH
jgi:hypothetical protein